MATDEERLVVALEARVRDFEKNFNRARRTAVDDFRAIEARAKVSADRLESILTRASARVGIAAKGFAIGIVGGMFSATAAIDGARRSLEEFSKIQDKANSTGLDSEFLQELGFAADQGGVAFDKLAGALEAFNRNSGLAVANKGKMVTTLKALNPELLRNIQLAESQEQRVRLAADAIARASSASERAALSSALFGDAGAELVEVFRDGSAGIDAMARKARDLGLVIDRDLIAKSEALGDELSIATRVMDLQFKQALIDLAPVLISTAQLAGNVASGVRSVVDAMRGLEGKSARGLEESLERAERDLAAARAGKERMPMLSAPYDKQIATSEAQVAAIRREMVNRTLERIKPDLERANAMYASTAPGTKTERLKPTPPADASESDRRTSSRNSAVAAALREAEAVRDLIAELEFEHALIGASDIEREQMNALRRAGASATDEQRARIRDLIGAIHSEHEALEAANEQMRTVADIGRDVLGGLISDLRAGKSQTDILANAVSRLADRLQNELLNALFSIGGAGGSGIFGWIGKLFGFSTGGLVSADPWRGLRLANGGRVSGPGGPTDDRIPAMLSNGEFVVNATATKQHAALLAAINSGQLPGFAGGGTVGDAIPRSFATSSKADWDQPISLKVDAPITINGSSGTPEQNADLAKRMAKEMDAVMRGVVVSELQRQLRPGNLFNR